MNLKKIGKVLTSKFVGTGPSSYEKRIYRAAVLQRLRNTDLDECQSSGVRERASVDGIATCCGLDGPRFEPQGAKRLSLVSTCPGQPLAYPGTGAFCRR